MEQLLKAILEILKALFGKKENTVSVDVVPDLTVKDDVALAEKLTEELQQVIPDKCILITVDHNYSE